MKNLKKLTRKEQQKINGGGPIRKCHDHPECGYQECCEGGMCRPSLFYPMCGPILE
ncbi:bacteriocin-like protein [Chryseobacterium vrystaatense]|uniref:Bacteriocin-type signal sequence-containing protein n=1 Tax=Chryseobacterium vrystaatense TaxID=307480 RepID=A0A1M5AJU0_9FLAO|nr:hypothetical protein [Chryseobacterium vrystaatense]SHF30425.1 hypothetical protein SAMN02787073_1946 [Chryseobacterium vrystaatense]